MRPETKKLIELRQSYHPNLPNVEGSKIVFVSHMQEIIDLETKPLESRIQRLVDELEQSKEETEDYKTKIIEAEATGYSFGRADAESENDSYPQKTLRDEFAIMAPQEIPPWFMAQHSVDTRIIERHDGRIIEYSKSESNQDLIFKWRFYYADQMMKEREL